MKIFESDVQLLKYEVLSEVIKLTLEGSLSKKYKCIALKIIPGPKPITRCCIYRERAIIHERVKGAMGGDIKNDNVIEVIGSACDECPIHRYTVNESCRGCIAHRCSEVCPFGAIYHVDRKAYIDTNKCKECGKCKTVCPYNAISDVMRPCQRACSAKALAFDENMKAVINNEKCIQCGACVYQCPFGAIVDKSSVVDIVKALKRSKVSDKVNMYAIIAPAIASQFTYAKIGQVVTGIKKLGFKDVIEVALGADMVAKHEAQEFIERSAEGKTMTSSCCPAFVSYVKKNYPELVPNISTTVSPMIAISKLIKNTDKDAKIVFIGPCTAKKDEINDEDLIGITDYVMTFEELQAMLYAFDINIEECEESPLNNSSFYGRIFARSGGLTEAVRNIINTQNLDVDFRPVRCDGLSECDKALKLLKFKRLDGNFIEGMACIGGCIRGAGCLSHGPKDANEVDKYGKLALEPNAEKSLRIIKVDTIDLERKF